MIQLEKSGFPGKGDTLIFFLYEGDVKKNSYFARLNEQTKGFLARKAEKFEFAGKKGEHIWSEGIGPYERMIVYGIGPEKELTPAVFRDALGNAIRLAASSRSDAVSFFYPHAALRDPFEAGKQAALGFALSQYTFDKYKKKPAGRKGAVRNLHILFEKEIPKGFDEGVQFGQTVAEGVALARDMVNEPASALHPEQLVKHAFEIEKMSGGTVKAEILGRDECERLGMGLFLGVAQGSDREPKFIILSYEPDRTKKAKKTCLVGKSITFDSGGISIKPSPGMEEMKSDMAGGAAVLGVFRILAVTGQVKRNVYGILPACENMPSGSAIKPGDVLTGLNGKTAEVINTDAEGRLALAHAVAYAEKHIKPDEIIDLATLTGACKVALGDDIAGLFGNDSAFNRKFLDHAKREGELAWELPLHKPYLSLLKSQVADIRNISGKGWGGAITGALFIGDFLEHTKWIHIDIAGPSYITHGPEGITGTGGTGWGVLSIISYLMQP
jgi:leucyl aminopeptidase